jgi:hypothetical protein
VALFAALFNSAALNLWRRRRSAFICRLRSLLLQYRSQYAARAAAQCSNRPSADSTHAKMQHCNTICTYSVLPWAARPLSALHAAGGRCCMRVLCPPFLYLIVCIAIDTSGGTCHPRAVLWMPACRAGVCGCAAVLPLVLAAVRCSVAFGQHCTAPAASPLLLLSAFDCSVFTHTPACWALPLDRRWGHLTLSPVASASFSHLAPVACINSCSDSSGT